MSLSNEGRLRYICPECQSPWSWFFDRDEPALKCSVCCFERTKPAESTPAPTAEPSPGYYKMYLSEQARAERAEAEVKALREALYEATESLGSIRRLAGKKGEDMADMDQVIGYATSRENVARATLDRSGR